MHGKEKQDLELSTDDKLAFQKTMDEFVEEVSDLSDTILIYTPTMLTGWKSNRL